MASKNETNILSAQNVFNNEKQDLKEEAQDDLGKAVDIVMQTWALVNKNALKHGIVFYKR